MNANTADGCAPPDPLIASAADCRPDKNDNDGPIHYVYRTNDRSERPSRTSASASASAAATPPGKGALVGTPNRPALVARVGDAAVGGTVCSRALINRLSSGPSTIYKRRRRLNAADRPSPALRYVSSRQRPRSPPTRTLSPTKNSERATFVTIVNMCVIWAHNDIDVDNDDRRSTTTERAAGGVQRVARMSTTSTTTVPNETRDCARVQHSAHRRRAGGLMAAAWRSPGRLVPLTDRRVRVP
uniref:Uncharacterized protein n=1 Tax=Plectus sambesii TaxID=2011161 RepID=A0A914UXQ4_9BILA